MTMGQPAPTGADAQEAAVPRIIIEQERDLECQGPPRLLALDGPSRSTTSTTHRSPTSSTSPNNVVSPHRHTVDEVMLLLEGGLTLHGTAELLGPGSVIFLGANNAYGFDVGPEGVKWLMNPSPPPQRRRQGGPISSGARRRTSKRTRGEFIAGPAVDKLPWTSLGDGLETRRVIED